MDYRLERKIKVIKKIVDKDFLIGKKECIKGLNSEIIDLIHCTARKYFYTAISKNSVN
jgi:hypothetical protein